MEVCLQRLNYCSQRLGGYAVYKGWWYWLYPSDIFWGRKNTGHVWLSSGVDRVWFLCGILPAHTDGWRREITWSRTIVSQDRSYAYMNVVAALSYKISNQKVVQTRTTVLSPERDLVRTISTCIFRLFTYRMLYDCNFFWNWQGISLPWHCQFLLGLNYASISFGCFAQERLLVVLLTQFSVCLSVSLWMT